MATPRSWKGVKEGGQLSAAEYNALCRAVFEAFGVNGITVTMQAGRLQISGGPGDAPGFVRDYAGIIDGTHPVPAGYLPCDGAAVSRTTYARLFAAIGETYGVGDSSTTFNVPDLRQRVAVGAGNAGGTVSAYDLGDSGGYNFHGQTENNHPDHQGQLDLNHTHDVPLSWHDVCDGPPDGGGCLYGTEQIPDYTANLQTGDPDSWGTDDGVPSAASPDGDQGSISKTGNVVDLTLKHGGWTNKDDNIGDFTDDSDNRPPFLALWKLIRY